MFFIVHHCTLAQRKRSNHKTIESALVVCPHCSIATCTYCTDASLGRHLFVRGLVSLGHGVNLRMGILLGLREVRKICVRILSINQRSRNVYPFPATSSEFSPVTSGRLLCSNVPPPLPIEDSLKVAHSSAGLSQAGWGDLNRTTTCHLFSAPFPRQLPQS